MMRVNTSKSMEIARRVKERFGTWAEVRQAARYRDGEYVIEARPEKKEERNPTRPASAY